MKATRQVLNLLLANGYREVSRDQDCIQLVKKRQVKIYTIKNKISFLTTHGNWIFIPLKLFIIQSIN